MYDFFFFPKIENVFWVKMCMMSFIELQKISELSFECMCGFLCNVYLLYKMAATPKIDLFPALNGTLLLGRG